ncbi:DNA-binding transcriptional response regulator [Stieleria varia]|uniref:Response regulator receiver domain protein n=1 Tax=Stieleria varia TaxID=2528005 RepID=A0A5C6B7I7_9BACT|nr:hypothetical protein [Stieleria varia]TWU07767.1 Response regulator receiver domain protein [Stieleria varia]
MRQQPESGYRRILIIDDNEAIHRDFDKIFAADDQCNDLSELDAELFGNQQSNGSKGKPTFALTHAMQGKEGFGIVQRAHQNGDSFGAAFVDMRMPPGWDGVETIEHLWRVDPHLQVVICTAFSDHSWEDITSRLGHTDRLLVLKKPFDEIEAVQLATSLCEKRRLLEESLQRIAGMQQRAGEQTQKLRAADANAEMLLDSISSILISVNEFGCVSRWNRVATQGDCTAIYRLKTTFSM